MCDFVRGQQIGEEHLLLFVTQAAGPLVRRQVGNSRQINQAGESLAECARNGRYGECLERRRAELL